MNDSLKDSVKDSVTNSLAEGISKTLVKVNKEVSLLATEDFSSVRDGLMNIVQEEITANPIGTMVAAVGIGFGLGALNSGHLKLGAMRIGKLLAMKALSNFEPKVTGVENVSQAS